MRRGPAHRRAVACCAGLWAVVCGAPPSVLGCGYRFEAGGAQLPEGLRTVFVPVVVNRTAEPTLEVAMTQALREEVGRAGVMGGPESEGRLECELRGLGFLPGLTQLRGAPPQPVPVYRLTATLHLRLKKGAQVVAEQDVAATEDFLSAQGDVLGTESNRAAALRRLARALAREGYERVASGF